MNRRWALTIFLIVVALVVSSVTPRVFTAHAGDGCAALASGLMTGAYFEGQTRITGSLTFSAGETITVGTKEEGTLKLIVAGPSNFSQEGTPPL